MKLPTVNVRPEVLNAWLQVAGCSKTRLAQELNVSKARVSQLFTTDVELSAHLIAKLLMTTSIPFDRLFRVAAYPLARKQKLSNSSRKQLREIRLSS